MITVGELKEKLKNVPDSVAVIICMGHVEGDAEAMEYISKDNDPEYGDAFVIERGG